MLKNVKNDVEESEMEFYRTLSLPGVIAGKGDRIRAQADRAIERA